MLLILWFAINFVSVSFPIHECRFLLWTLDQCVYLSLKALTKISDVMEPKPILKGTRLQSICRCVENHFAVQSICDRVLNFDLQPHYQKQTHGTDVMD